LRSSDADCRVTAYSLVWIHPSFNREFCWFYDATPGDLPNFYLTRGVSDLGEEPIDIESIDELIYWLEERATAASA
jgi:hypothetical protein